VSEAVDVDLVVTWLAIGRSGERLGGCHGASYA
jgi:hypothetical protein